MTSTKRRIAAVLLALICMFASMSNGERAAWDCPECGKKGNTGNFCGNCRQPAPGSESEPIITPQPEDTNSSSGFGYTIDSADLKEKADENAQIIQRLNRYALCSVIDTVASGEITWYQVIYDGKTGYIDGMYLKQMTTSELNRFLRSAEYIEGKRGNAETPTPTAEPTEKPTVTAVPTEKPTPPQNPRENRSIAVGDIITFGHYEQDNNLNNGQEAIEWIVLDYDATEKKLLLLSRYGLDAKPYNKSFVNITWEKSSLRSWMNEDFLNAAFTAEEQQWILKTNVNNSKEQGYSGWNTDSGNNTVDQIFLLSFQEAFKEYFKGTKSRICKPTPYAIAQATYDDNFWDGKGNWWLRSPGNYQNCAEYVNIAGSHDYNYVYHDSYCVRPALWLNLESGGQSFT